ncbi:non-hydrolyzing UDP-N-acetylglucosamine 2-epimerase [Cellulosimicrobium composti]|uniref:non-hydrolyzing UDP-N-acetylglucosamine 2-epimerase n=1 Tax=Cellulosimicrobium composti TaxID=2672572 RepID=UPI0037A9B6BD
MLGTRPEMVKLAGIVRELGDQARIFHTGQHYDPSLSSEVWQSLGLPVPEAVLDVGGGSRAAQVGGALLALDEIFRSCPPRAVVVQGDTNATLAGALAANANSIPLVHVEAGLRSHDRAMPEEHNRVLVDHIADVLCAPTQTNRANLIEEAISSARVHVTGNTVVEAVQAQALPDDEQELVLARHGLRAGGYVLATIHRPENTDDQHTLETVLHELGKVRSRVVLPLHPRTRARVEQAGLEGLLSPLTVIEPLSPPQFLALAAHCAVMVSDSGGLQEECSVLKRPLLVVRRSTERPEVMGTFAERVTPGPAIADTVNAWLGDIASIHARLARLPSPYGDGSASSRIAALINDVVLPAREVAA